MIDENKYPLVSVIVPIYNAEKYIAETLNSILASDYLNFEVICVNDGSNDESANIIQHYIDKDERVNLIFQENRGACAARNNGISNCNGEYILPFDSDDIIDPKYISRAVEILESDCSIRVVSGMGEYFGEKEGEWKVNKFSLKLLARKNMIPVCSMYRREDWSRVGGYCMDIKTREDWDFWISVLKDGGSFVRLPYVCFHYRIRSTSKRVKNRKFKTEVIDILNKRHPEFFEQQLCGPLRHHRSWSVFINKIYRFFHSRRIVVSAKYNYLRLFIQALPVRWKNGEGVTIHNRRNELRIMNFNGVEMVVKSFSAPNVLNKFVYGLFRKSKAQRSYEYAVRLLDLGINTPHPVAYYTERNGLLFDKSFYISRRSMCHYTFYDVIENKELQNRELYLRHVGKITAVMHNNGIYPLDYSGGNILLDVIDGKPYSELVDLNRMYFGDIDIDKGCRGFERLNVESEALKIMAVEYAKYRGFEELECVELIQKYRWKKHNHK